MFNVYHWGKHWLRPGGTSFALTYTGITYKTHVCLIPHSPRLILCLLHHPKIIYKVVEIMALVPKLPTARGSKVLQRHLLGNPSKPFLSETAKLKALIFGI